MSNVGEYVILPVEYWVTQPSGLIFCGFFNMSVRTQKSVYISRTHRQPARIYYSGGTFHSLSNENGRYWIYDGNVVRKLSICECERLQGFPTNWTEGISNTQRYKCIGNAVTTNVITALMDRMYDE